MWKPRRERKKILKGVSGKGEDKKDERLKKGIIRRENGRDRERYRERRREIN